MKKISQQHVENIIERYPDKRSAVLPIMQHLQKENENHLSSSGMEEAARRVDMSMSKIYGIATYYTMFNIRPVGKFHLHSGQRKHPVRRGFADR